MWYGIQYNMVSPIQTVSEYEKKEIKELSQTLRQVGLSSPQIKYDGSHKESLRSFYCKYNSKVSDMN